MSLRFALMFTLVISAILRFLLGSIMIAAQYEIDTLVYRYVFVFLGLGIILSGFKKLWTLIGVLRYTK